MTAVVAAWQGKKATLRGSGVSIKAYMNLIDHQLYEVSVSESCCISSSECVTNLE
jgi:hypothetical protein